MPFLNEIAAFIDETLHKGSLNKAKLQPVKFHGMSSQLVRAKIRTDRKKQVEVVPAIIQADGTSVAIVPETKIALQIYHKLLANVYSYEKKSHGNDHQIKQVSELSMVVLSNSKLTKRAKEALEPVLIFGMPQHLSEELRAELQLIKCLITPIGSNMDHVQVFRQEYPQSDYFLNEQNSMFLVKYRVELLFDQNCVDACLC